MQHYSLGSQWEVGGTYTPSRELNKLQGDFFFYCYQTKIDNIIDTSKGLIFIYLYELPFIGQILSQI